MFLTVRLGALSFFNANVKNGSEFHLRLSLKIINMSRNSRISFFVVAKRNAYRTDVQMLISLRRKLSYQRTLVLPCKEGLKISRAVSDGMLGTNMPRCKEL